MWEEKATCHCPIRAFLFEEGGPMYTIFETGLCFLPVRWSASAYSPAAALRNEVPCVSPGCITRHRATHIYVSMASRTTRAWNVWTLFIGSFRRYIPWSNCFRSQPWVRSVGPIWRRARRAPRAVSTSSILAIKFSISALHAAPSSAWGRCIPPGCPRSTSLSVRML